MRILITSGGTRIPIDTVRHIANMSNGTFGSKIAYEALKAGHEVTFFHAERSKRPLDTYLSRNMSLIDSVVMAFKHYNKIRKYSHNLKEETYKTFDDYYAGLIYMLMSNHDTQYTNLSRNTHKPFDIIILASAVSDYGTVPVDGKIRTKDNLKIELQPLPKVISKVRGIVGDKTKIVGFKLLVNSTKEELEVSARESLIKNNLDMVIANDLADIKQDKHKLLIVEKNKPTDDTELLTKFGFKDPNLLARIVVQRSTML